MPMGRVTWALAATGPLGRLGSRLHARLYRASGGRLGRGWFGAPVMVIETVGRKSGKPRATPVICVRDGDRFVAIPSNGGSTRVPAWFLNLRAAGEGVAVVRGKRHRVRPRIAEGEERERLWRVFAAKYPQVDDYTAYTDREFPVVVLEKV